MANKFSRTNPSCITVTTFDSKCESELEPGDFCYLIEFGWNVSTTTGTSVSISSGIKMDIDYMTEETVIDKVVFLRNFEGDMLYQSYYEVLSSEGKRKQYSALNYLLRKINR